jgi:hypothetical protein
MSRVKKFQAFLNEKYEENPEFRIKSFFVELEKNIRDWFDNGTLKANGAELGKIERSLTHATEKNLIFEFNDEEFFYQVYVIISITDVEEEDKLGACYVKVKKYDAADMTLLRSLGEDMDVSDLNEDKILELFSKLDEESSSVEEDESGEVTVSDEDTDLEDTSLV